MFEKHKWKSDILGKDAGHRPESLLKMSLCHRCFSNILLVTTSNLISTEVEHWSKMGSESNMGILLCKVEVQKVSRPKGI